MAFLLYDDDFTSAPRRERFVEDLKPSETAYWQARRESTLELNPTWQLGATRELEALEPFRTDFYTDEMGMQQPITRGGLDPADPRARRLSLEEANDRGRDVGLRFSEPPTEGQFEYLKTRKIAENERDAIIAQAPSKRVWVGGLLGDLAASAIDPLNIATAFVPVVRDTRFLQWATRFGRGPARAMKGAAEGFVGTAMITPLVYAQAQRLQQNYDANAVMADLAVGSALGAGLHWGGGLAKDFYKGELRLESRLYSLGSFIRRHDPRSAFEAKSKAGRDAPSVTKGENAQIVEAMNPTARASNLNVAVKSLSVDQFPRMDEILRGAPELTSISIPDTRFTATTRYRVPFSSADYARNTPGTAMLNEMAHSMVKTGQSPVKSLMQSFAGRYGKLKDVVVRQLGPTEFAAAAKTLVEVPEQRVVYDPLTQQLLVTEGATPGAIRHEIEKALDDLYGHKGDQAGAYRFKNSDNDGPVGLRQAIGELYHREPGRRPGQPTSARDAITKATEPQGDLMLTRGPQASRDAWDAVQEHKDRDLETIIKDEELEAVETIASANQGFVRDLGILEKIIPAEERAILDEAITRQAKQSAERDLFSAMDEVADAKEVNQSLRDAEMLIKAGPDRLAEVIRGKKTEGQVLAQMEAEGYVTRDVARRSIATYLNTIGLPAPEPEAPKIREISGEQMEEAIRLVQAGEDVDVAVRTAVQAGELLKAAEEALEAAETRFELPGEEGKGAGLEDDLFNEMMEILDKEAITSTEQLAEFESEVVVREQALLAEHPQTEHLANMTEKDEFDEANRNRALRKGSGAVERGERAARDLGSQGRALEDGLFATRVGDGSADSGGARDVIERERGASGGHRPAPETVASYGGWAVPTRVITPDNSIEVGVTPRIVELDPDPITGKGGLVHAEGALQVRDRSRKESRAEAIERALKLDPEQLLPSRVADTGAPIVRINQDGSYTIISGNGRVMSIREVYRDETLGWKARQYRDRIGVAADGYHRPVLVSVITDELSEGELVRFAERANRSRIAEMSVTEKAQRDANVAGYEIMGLYQGGDFTKRENQPFLRSFLRKVATTQELGDLSKNGVLTKAGVDRLNAAVLAAAYDDANLLSLMLESADLNIKSIANAYRDVAPAFMKLRAQIAQGIVREEMDLTPFMIEAARFVSKARDEGVKIGNALAQSDALNPIDPTVEALVRQFYNPQLTRANSALRIGQWLQFYVDSALEKRTGGFLEDTTSIRDVVAATDRRVERQGETFDAEDETSIADIAAHVGAGDPQGRAAQPQPEAGSSGAGAGEPVKGRAKQGDAGQAAEANDLLKQFAKLSAAKKKDIGAQLFDGRTFKSGSEVDRSLARRLEADLAMARRQDAAGGEFGPSDITGEIYARFINELRSVMGTESAPAPTSLANRAIEKVGGIEEVKRALQTPEATDADVLKLFQGLERAGVIDEAKVPAKAPDALPKASELINMTVKDLRALAKEQQIPLTKLTRKDDIVRRMRESGKFDEPAPAAKAEPVAQESFTTEQHIFHTAWMDSVDELNILVRNGFEGERPAAERHADKFDGKAKVVFDRLIRNYNEILDAHKNGEPGTAREALEDALDNAEQLDKLSDTSTARLFTQVAKSMARKHLVQEQAKPTPSASQIERAPVSDAVRRSFYDFLETDQPVKGAGHVAKVLKLSVEEAGHLIDEAIEAGWLKVNSKDQIIRVAKTARPARPDRPKLDAPSFVDNASSRLAQILDEEMLGNPVDGFKLDDNARSYIIGSDGKLYEIYGDSFPHKEVYEHIDFLADGGIQISTFGYGGFGGQFTTVTRQAFFNLGRYLKMAEMKRSDVLWRPDPDTQGLAEFAFVKDSDKERFRGLGYKNLPDSYNELHENFKLKLDGPSFADVVGFRPRSNLERINFLSSRMSEINSKIDELRALRDGESLNDEQVGDINSQIDDLIQQYSIIEVEHITLDGKRGLAVSKFYKSTNYNELSTRNRELNNKLREAREEVNRLSKITGEEPVGAGGLVEQLQDELANRTPGEGVRDFSTRRQYQVARERYERLLDEIVDVGNQMDAIRKQADLVEFADTPKGWESAGEMDDIQAFVSHQEAQLQAHLAIQKVWDRSLHRIPDIIRLRIAERLQMGGYGRAAALFNPNSMTIVVSAADLYEIPNGRKPGETIPHELFHALRKIDLFTPEEWALLRREYAMAKGGFNEFDRQRYGSHYTNYWRDVAVKKGYDPDEPEMASIIEDKLVEEYAATEYGKWQEMRDKNRETWQGRLWQRVSDFLEDVYNSFKRFADDLKMKLNRRGMDLVEDEWLPLRGPDNVRELFRAIERGDFARAWADASAGRTGPDNSMSMASMALQEMSEDLNAQMRTLAQDKSESVGRLKAEVLKRLAPCASYHL